MIPANLHELNNMELARVFLPLDELERRVIIIRFGLANVPPVTLAGASEVVGLPREEVRRIELRAMEKLGWVNLVG